MSTYSTNLGLTLIGTGEEDGTWGATTNTNLGTLLEQAISGYVTQAVVTGADTTITIPSGASGTARNMYIELTGTGGTNTNLIVPANKKLYFIYNNASGAVTVKVSGQTGVPVPAGAKIVLVCDGTDIEVATNYMVNPTFSLTNATGLPLSTGVTGTLPIANGGTGVTGTPTNGQLLIGNGSGYTLATLTAGTGCTINNSAGGITINATGSGGSVTSVSGTGTVNGITLTGTVTTTGSLTLGGTLSGVSLSSQVTGTLPVANGGTGLTTTPSNGALDIGNGTGFTRTTLTAGSGISITNGSGSITIASTGGGGVGTVTSVGLNMPLQFNVVNSPVTSSGTLTASWASQSANSVLAAPNGSAGTPSFRTLVAADIPALSYAPTTGSTSITTLGTIGTGTWQGSTISTTYTSAKVTDVQAGTGVSVSGTTGSVTVSIGQAVGTASNVQHNSLGIGTAASGSAGDIRATGDVTAYYSSDRKFKENVKDIENPVAKVKAIGGKTFDWTDEYITNHGGEDGFFLQKQDFGVIAQDVEAVFPMAVKRRQDGSLAVDYQKLSALALAALAELTARVEALEAKQ